MSTHPGRPPRPFEEWALAAARNLDGTLTAPRGGATPEPGSLSEALALLLSPRLLGSRPPDGFPGVYVDASDPSGGVLGALYDAAFGPDVAHPDPAFRVYAVLDHEEGMAPTLEAVGILIGRHKDGLVFSEPGLPLPEISCSTLPDLRRLHARVLSAANRV